MKILQVVLVVVAVSIGNIAIAQDKKLDSSKVKKENYLDMGTEILTDVFGSNLDGNVDGKKLSFLDMLEQTQLSKEQKVEYRNLYYLQAKDLTKKQKDSLGKAIEKKIKEAKSNDE